MAPSQMTNFVGEIHDMETNVLLQERIWVLLRTAFSDDDSQRLLAPGATDPCADLWGELELDSLDIVDFSMRLESEFQVKIPEEDLERLRTVRGIAEYIAAKSRNHA